MRRRSVAAGVALSIPAAAFAAAVRLRNAWYDRRGPSGRAAVPVISIGNLAVGGTGKTPLVAWIARHLQADGFVPAVVSRGYRGRAGPGPLVVSTGEGPRVNARTCGDEPHLLARSLRGVIVVVGADRIEGARCAATAGAGIVLLDDGFQHRRLARDLDIVVLDARAPFGSGHFFPWGILRERPASLARCQLVVLTRVREGDRAAGAIDAVRATGYSGPIVRSGHRTAGFHDAVGAPCPTPASALAFCGIGDPDLFQDDLRAAGCNTVGFRVFRDHHPYTLSRWEALIAEAKALGVPLVTTDKDLSRVQAAAGASLARAPLLVLRIETIVWDERVLLDAVHRAARSHVGSAVR